MSRLARVHWKVHPFFECSPIELFSLLVTLFFIHKFSPYVSVFSVQCLLIVLFLLIHDRDKIEFKLLLFAVVDEAWRAFFSRCCTIEQWQANDPLSYDFSTRKNTNAWAKEMLKKIKPNDPTVGTRMKISLPRPKDFINFKRWLQRAVKEREIWERKEKEISWKTEKLWENCGDIATLEVIKAFARFSWEILWTLHLKFECNLRIFHCCILERFEIRRKWKTMQTCRRRLHLQCEGERGWRITMTTRRKCYDKQRNTKNRHVFLGWCSYMMNIPFENMLRFFILQILKVRGFYNFISSWKAQQQIKVNLKTGNCVGGNFFSFAWVGTRMKLFIILIDIFWWLFWVMTIATVEREMDEHEMISQFSLLQ